MKNVQLHSGIYVCLMFYHVGRTHQRRVWDEPWFHKAGCKGTLWLWTGWWSGAASTCCAVCLTETLRRMQIPNMNITSWLWLLRLHSVSRKTGLCTFVSWKIIYVQGPKSYLPWLKLHLKNIFIYFFLNVLFNLPWATRQSLLLDPDVVVVIKIWKNVIHTFNI